MSGPQARAFEAETAARYQAMTARVQLEIERERLRTCTRIVCSVHGLWLDNCAVAPYVCGGTWYEAPDRTLRVPLLRPAPWMLPSARNRRRLRRRLRGAERTMIREGLGV